MKKRTIIILPIVLIILMHPYILRADAIPTNFQAVQTFFGSPTNPVEASPGDKSVTINVVVQNWGSQTYSGLDATLWLRLPFTNITGGNTARSYYSGSIPVGQTATLQFQLNIDSGAAVGSYQVLMSISYG